MEMESHAAAAAYVPTVGLLSSLRAQSRLTNPSSANADAHRLRAPPPPQVIHPGVVATPFVPTDSVARGTQHDRTPQHHHSQRSCRSPPPTLEQQQAAPVMQSVQLSPSLYTASATVSTAVDAAAYDAVTNGNVDGGRHVSLLPANDVQFVLASMTWNVDLLLILLSHAPDPMQLTEAREAADAAAAQAPQQDSSTPWRSSTPPSHDRDTGGSTATPSCPSDAHCHRAPTCPTRSPHNPKPIAPTVAETAESASSPPDASLVSLVKHNSPVGPIADTPLTWSNFLFREDRRPVLHARHDTSLSHIDDREPQHQKESLRAAKTSAPCTPSLGFDKQHHPGNNSPLLSKHGVPLLAAGGSSAPGPPLHLSHSHAGHRRVSVDPEYFPTLQEVLQWLETGSLRRRVDLMKHNKSFCFTPTGGGAAASFPAGGLSDPQLCENSAGSPAPPALDDRMRTDVGLPSLSPSSFVGHVVSGVAGGRSKKGVAASMKRTSHHRATNATAIHRSSQHSHPVPPTTAVSSRQDSNGVVEATSSVGHVTTAAVPVRGRRHSGSDGSTTSSTLHSASVSRVVSVARSRRSQKRGKLNRTVYVRNRAIRVYMPSITEGPRAHLLYTAPDVEAELIYEEFLRLYEAHHRQQVAARQVATGEVGRGGGIVGASASGNTSLADPPPIQFLHKSSPRNMNGSRSFNSSVLSEVAEARLMAETCLYQPWARNQQHHTYTEGGEHGAESSLEPQSYEGQNPGSIIKSDVDTAFLRRYAVTAASQGSHESSPFDTDEGDTTYDHRPTDSADDEDDILERWELYPSRQRRRRHAVKGMCANSYYYSSSGNRASGSGWIPKTNSQQRWVGTTRTGTVATGRTTRHPAGAACSAQVTALSLPLASRMTPVSSVPIDAASSLTERRDKHLPVEGLGGQSSRLNNHSSPTVGTSGDAVPGTDPHSGDAPGRDVRHGGCGPTVGSQEDGVSQTSPRRGPPVSHLIGGALLTKRRRGARKLLLRTMATGATNHGNAFESDTDGGKAKAQPARSPFVSAAPNPPGGPHPTAARESRVPSLASSPTTDRPRSPLKDHRPPHAAGAELTTTAPATPPTTFAAADQRTSPHFFVQKFYRAFFVVIVAQLRLPPQPPGWSTPVGLGGRRSGRLCKAEAHALWFVRRHMESFRYVVKKYIMRSDEEVIRRSAQGILTDLPPTSASPTPAGHDAAPSWEAPPSPRHEQLFNQARLHAVLSEQHVASFHAHHQSMRHGGGDDHEDVAPLLTDQVYLSGKDAAWQPLLLDVLHISRVLQCYAESVSPSGAAAPTSTPHHHTVLGSLKRFIAEPAPPVLMGGATSSAKPPVDDRTGPGTFAQEESNIFYDYLRPLVEPRGASVYLPSERSRAWLPAAHDMPHPTAATSPAWLFPVSPGGLLDPLQWKPYAVLDGPPLPDNATTNGGRPSSSSPGPGIGVQRMQLDVARLPISGRVVYRWVIPAEDTARFNLSVFFQSSIFAFLQGGALPPPTTEQGLMLELQLQQQAQTDGAQQHSPEERSWRRAADYPTSGCEDAGLLPPRPRTNTLVHCSAGMHRSCGMVIAFLLWLLYQCEIMERWATPSRASTGRRALDRAQQLEEGTEKKDACQRLLQLCVAHVKAQRRMAEPIPTVMFLLMHFTSELGLGD